MEDANVECKFVVCCCIGEYLPMELNCDNVTFLLVYCTQWAKSRKKGHFGRRTNALFASTRLKSMLFLEKKCLHSWSPSSGTCHLKKIQKTVDFSLWGKQCIYPTKMRPKLWKSHIVQLAVLIVNICSIQESRMPEDVMIWVKSGPCLDWFNQYNSHILFMNLLLL